GGARARGGGAPPDARSGRGRTPRPPPARPAPARETPPESPEPASGPASGPRRAAPRKRPRRGARPAPPLRAASIGPRFGLLLEGLSLAGSPADRRASRRGGLLCFRLLP